MEKIAGNYRTGQGPLKCEPAKGDGLECTWGRNRKVRLAFDEAGENLVGTWSFPNNGAHGPVIFPVSRIANWSRGSGDGPVGNLAASGGSWGANPEKVTPPKPVV
jgi:hypothetical protein